MHNGMQCLFCHRRLGFWSRLRDQEYCSPEHRLLMRSQSARALREYRERYEDSDNTTSVFVKPIDGISRPAQHSSTSSTVMFAALLVVALMIGSTSFSSDDATSGEGRDMFAGLRAQVRSYTTVKRTDNFHNLQSWMTPPQKVGGADWKYHQGFIRPGRLRLWNDSMGLRDYQVEFVGQIEQRALGWAFRATDARNYYAAKIVITKPGPLPSADLVRYAVINGAEADRKVTSLPLLIRNDTLYKVQMTIKGHDFSAMVNGKMVDSWNDSRIAKGGIGFFSEQGEMATLRYVTVTDTNTMLGRMLAQFGFVMPVVPVAPAPLPF